jgi:membrane protein
LSLGELYEASRLRIPIADVSLPLAEDATGRPVMAALDELRVPLRHLLKRPVGSLHADDEE